LKKAKKEFTENDKRFNEILKLKRQRKKSESSFLESRII
jgi:hypothetical protein